MFADAFAPNASPQEQAILAAVQLDTGHFALETHAAEIAAAIRGFLTGQ